MVRRATLGRGVTWQRDFPSNKLTGGHAGNLTLKRRHFLFGDHGSANENIFANLFEEPGRSRAVK